MLLEIDEIVVEKELWEKAKNGDVAVQKQMRKELHDLKLYMHNFIVAYHGGGIEEIFGPDLGDDKFVVITLREAEGANIVDSINIDNNFLNRGT